MSAKIPRLFFSAMPRLLEMGRTSADNIKASRTVAFELVKLFVLAIQSLPKKMFEGTGVSLCQAVDQMVQTAQLLWIPNFRSWNESFIPSQRDVDVGETTQKRVSPCIPKDSVNGDLP